MVEGTHLSLLEGQAQPAGRAGSPQHGWRALLQLCPLLRKNGWLLKQSRWNTTNLNLSLLTVPIRWEPWPMQSLMEPISATKPQQESTERRWLLSLLRDLPVPKGWPCQSNLSPGKELLQGEEHIFFQNSAIFSVGLPWWLRQSRICLQCRRHRSDPWFRKIPWRREWTPTPVFLPGEFHGQRSLVGCYIAHGVIKSWTWPSD